jgi:hypothetical protein
VYNNALWLRLKTAVCYSRNAQRAQPCGPSARAFYIIDYSCEHIVQYVTVTNS